MKQQLSEDEIELRKIAKKIGVSLQSIVDPSTGRTRIPELQDRIILTAFCHRCKIAYAEFCVSDIRPTGRLRTLMFRCWNTPLFLLLTLCFPVVFIAMDGRFDGYFIVEISQWDKLGHFFRQTCQ